MRDYLDNLADYSVVESVDNMRNQLYYLQCIAVELQVIAIDSNFNLFSYDLSNIIFSGLDLMSFRSSLRRKLTDSSRTFKSLKYEYSHSGNRVTVKRPNWYYDFVLLGKGDYDHDGFEDLMVLFVDQSLSHSYYSSDVLLLHKTSRDLLWRVRDVTGLIH